MRRVAFWLAMTPLCVTLLVASADDGVEFGGPRKPPTVRPPGVKPATPARPAPARPAPPRAQAGPAGWDLTKSKEFQVYLPGKPTYNNEDIDTAIGVIKMHTYIVEQNNGNVAYGLIYSDYPTLDLSVVDPADMLLGAQEGLLSKFPGSVLNTERKIKYGENPGRELEFVQKDGADTIYGAWRLYMVGKRMYQISIVSINSKIDPTIQKNLFDNFKLAE